MPRYHQVLLQVATRLVSKLLRYPITQHSLRILETFAKMPHHQPAKHKHGRDRNDKLNCPIMLNKVFGLDLSSNSSPSTSSTRKSVIPTHGTHNNFEYPRVYVQNGPDQSKQRVNVAKSLLFGRGGKMRHFTRASRSEVMSEQSTSSQQSMKPKTVVDPLIELDVSSRPEDDHSRGCSIQINTKGHASRHVAKRHVKCYGKDRTCKIQVWDERKSNINNKVGNLEARGVKLLGNWKQQATGNNGYHEGSDSKPPSSSGGLHSTTSSIGSASSSEMDDKSYQGDKRNMVKRGERSSHRAFVDRPTTTEKQARVFNNRIEYVKDRDRRAGADNIFRVNGNLGEMVRHVDQVNLGDSTSSRSESKSSSDSKESSKRGEMGHFGIEEILARRNDQAKSCSSESNSRIAECSSPPHREVRVYKDHNPEWRREGILQRREHGGERYCEKELVPRVRVNAGHHSIQYKIEMMGVRTRDIYVFRCCNMDMLRVKAMRRLEGGGVIMYQKDLPFPSGYSYKWNKRSYGIDVCIFRKCKK